MAFPEAVLTADEQVVLHLHPHWKRLIGPFFVLILSITVVAAITLMGPPTAGQPLLAYGIVGLAVVLVLWLSVWPIISWRTTHFVFTDERVILQHGVLARDRRDIPLARINDHSMDQSFAERLFGCGTLTIESAGERGQSVLHDVPGVEHVQTMLYELVEQDRDRHQLDQDELREVLQEQQRRQEPAPGPTDGL